MVQSIWKKMVAHKIATITGIIVLAVVGYYGYGWIVGTPSQIKYVLSKAERGSVVMSVSGSGQVLAINQTDIKPKASGEVLVVNVVNGQTVKAGDLMVQLDARDAQKAVRDAEASLESANISLQKLVQPADELSLTQAENSLARALESKEAAQSNLSKAYEDGFNTVADTFLDIPTVIAGLQDMLFSSAPSLGSAQWNIDYYADQAEKYNDKASDFRKDTFDKYQAARTAYDKNFQDYKSAGRFSDIATIEALMGQTYETTKSIAEAVKSTNNLIQFYKDEFIKQGATPATTANTHLAILNSYTGTTNGHLLELLSVINTIKNSKDAIVNADRLIKENTESLAKLKAGPDQLDIDSAKLSVKQRENALMDAKEKLADYFVRAPYDGTIAKLTVKKGDAVSAATAVLTLVTSQKLAEISLNEVDVSKVKVGQKTTLKFDAIDGLSISGVVAEIDTVGTVTQGVVNYNVKIAFDTQDDRIKPGMSVGASVITEVAQDVLFVSNSAVKTQGANHYVEVFESAGPMEENAQGVVSAVPPVQRIVEIGLSNNTETQIVSGLKEGEQVVTRTIDPTAATQQTSGLFGGGGVRIPR
jgi:HlyD family secretion protein